MSEPAARLAEQIAAVVRGCPGVAGLSGGPVATYLPGQVVRGVAVRSGSVVVAVTVTPGRPVREVAGEIRDRVAPLAPGRAVDVHIEDIDLGGPPE